MKLHPSRGLVGALLVGMVLVGGVWAASLISTDSSPARRVERPSLGRAPVVLTDLVRVESFRGVIRHSNTRTLYSGIGGVVTWTPEEGVLLGRGDVIAEIDGQPVFLFFGDRPMWRELPGSDGAGRHGLDVLQLESNLVAMGYGTLTADTVFDDLTVSLVESWQRDMGLASTGRVDMGRLIYTKGRVRVGRFAGAVGSMLSPGDPLVEVSDPTLEVGLELPVDRPEIGKLVAVELPDGTTLSGTIVAIAPVRTGSGDRSQDDPMLAVSIELEDAAAAQPFRGHQVDVELVARAARGVLAVPVRALLALAEGGYAVELERSGEIRLVPVDTGMFADGLVEVEGALVVGDSVVVPA